MKQKNILIEFLTANGRYGAGEYHRRVVLEILKKIKEENLCYIKIFALFDSKVSISFEDMRIDTLGKTYDVDYIDLQKHSIPDVIIQYNIDTFFIACSQRIGVYPEIKDVKCKVICVTHDLLYEEWYNSHLYEYWSLLTPRHVDVGVRASVFWRVLRLCRSTLINFYKIFLSKSIDSPIGYEYLEVLKPIVEMLKHNPNSKNIVVSEYTKATMMFNFGFSEEDIKVLYSPERKETTILEVENKTLDSILKQKKKYILMVSADRVSKNVFKVLDAFRKYSEIDNDAILVLVGYKGDVNDRMIKLPFLSDSDLEHAMRNCYALIYPSYFEGFGYPPLEAMRYGRPVLCSNTTSIPEIMGEAPIYFSPIYSSDIFYSLLKLAKSDYSKMSDFSLKQYNKIRERQEKDLDTLVNLILN